MSLPDVRFRSGFFPIAVSFGLCFNNKVGKLRFLYRRCPFRVVEGGFLVVETVKGDLLFSPEVMQLLGGDGCIKAPVLIENLSILLSNNA